MPKVKRVFIGIAALLAAGLTHQAASAQVGAGYSGSSSMTTFDNEEGMRTLGVFGICYASNNLTDALALIATEPGSRAEADTYRRLFRRDSQSCLGEATELRVPVSLVRGAIAEGLYKRGAALPANLALAAPAAGAPIRTLSEAARCYIAAHRDEARALVERIPPGGRRELAALNAMAPAFFRCVPDTARGRSFDATLIRFRLAEALFRMAPAPPAAAGQR
ncbi:MAG: hypothetical protein QOJ53_2329 [Sphingomonadales bacterium]|jgi:hypothetical protein|nr:hypothetical protein [Sphingomonadales bacterium]MEA3047997.1 hypothetical protein [Sphingomonadales bacterium]